MNKITQIIIVGLLIINAGLIVGTRHKVGKGDKGLKVALENLEGRDMLSTPTIGTENGMTVVSFFYKDKDGKKSILSVPKARFIEFLQTQ